MNPLMHLQIPRMGLLLGLLAASQPRYNSQFAAMMAIHHHVSRNGYSHWTSGWIPVGRLLPTLERIHAKHGVFDTPDEMWVRKTKARIVVAPTVVQDPRISPDDGGARVYFVLLGNKNLRGERMRQVSDPKHPVNWVERYELAFDPIKEKTTWRLTQGAFDQYADRVASAVRDNDAKRLHAIAESLTKLPLTSGVSSDARRLLKTAQSSWNHRHRRSAGPSHHPFNASSYYPRVRARSGIAKQQYATHPNGDRQTLTDLVNEAMAEQRRRQSATQDLLF